MICMFDLLEIKDPSFIKKLNMKELKELCKDIRTFLIENISKTGGHLSSNLGIVEITVAMYYVFDPEKDKFLFDVGHQSYVHKILTGRAKDFVKLRQYGGMSGYINRAESKYDVWESGHSSTSISAMAGILNATDDKNFVITLIGDSSITNGVALEGLNYLGQKKENRAIIIFNDNKMGISKSVGALSKSFAKLRGNSFINGLKTFMTKISIKPVRRLFHKIKRSIKGFIQTDNIFEDMGFDYFGPYNGNDLKSVIRLFTTVKKHPKEPLILHLNTVKGKGYEFAEHDWDGSFHGVPPFNPETGKPLKSCDDKMDYSELVANFLLNKREKEDFTVITPAMIKGAKLTSFQAKYPDSLIDVGIAEEHAAVMAAGSVLAGKKSVLLMYSTFAQRAFDQFLNDIARQNLPVIIGIDRAGIVGEDGVTHQGLYDVSMFSLMPNIMITMPRNLQETIGLFNYAFTVNKPIVIRYPRNAEERHDLDYTYIANPSWEYINKGNKVNILGYGADIERINKLVKNNNIDANVIDTKIIKPIDSDALRVIFENEAPIIVFEQVVSSGTLYSKILEFKENNGFKSKVYSHSYNPDTLIPHGSLKDIYEHYGLSYNDILKSIEEASK